MKHLPFRQNSLYLLLFLLFAGGCSCEVQIGSGGGIDGEAIEIPLKSPKKQSASSRNLVRGPVTKIQTVKVYDIKMVEGKRVKGFNSDSYRNFHGQDGKLLFRIEDACMNCDTVWLGVNAEPEENPDYKETQSGDTTFLYLVPEDQNYYSYQILEDSVPKYYVLPGMGLVQRYSQHRYNDQGDLVYMEKDQAQFRNRKELRQMEDEEVFSKYDQNRGSIMEMSYEYN